MNETLAHAINYMLAGIIGMTYGDILIGIILCIVFGFAIGNYACSLVHRLPRGRLILDAKPYCGHCMTPLQTRDLFPVISALLLRHRCRYCGVPFPTSHTWTEILVAVLFIIAFFRFGFSEHFLLVSAVGVFLITLAAIEANEKLVMGKILFCVAMFAIVNRTLGDSSIYGFLMGGFLGLMIGAALWHKQIKPVGHVYSLPIQAQLLALGGLCVGDKGLPLFFAFFAGLYAFFWLIKSPRRSAQHLLTSVPFGLAVILSLMYPLTLF